MKMSKGYATVDDVISLLRELDKAESDCNRAELCSGPPPREIGRYGEAIMRMHELLETKLEKMKQLESGQKQEVGVKVITDDLARWKVDIISGWVTAYRKALDDHYAAAQEYEVSEWRLLQKHKDLENGVQWLVTSDAEPDQSEEALQVYRAFESVIAGSN